MSYPSGFSRLHIGDEDTQRKAKGKGNVGRRVDEDLPSTFEEALLRADAIGVITWFRPVEESRVDAFWKKFFFLPNIWVSFPSSGPYYVGYMEEDRGGMNSIYWLEIHISEGLRFPLP